MLLNLKQVRLDIPVDYKVPLKSAPGLPCATPLCSPLCIAALAKANYRISFLVKGYDAKSEEVVALQKQVAALSATTGK